MTTKIISTSEEFYKIATEQAAKADGVIGSTFGMFIKQDSEARKFFDSFAGGNFIVGLYSPNPCKENCEDCAKKFQITMKYVTKFHSEQNQHQWVLTPGWHTKSICFRKGNDYTALIGSRNLGDSSWDDIAILVGGEYAKNMYQYINKSLKERRKK